MTVSKPWNSGNSVGYALRNGIFGLRIRSKVKTTSSALRSRVGLTTALYGILRCAGDKKYRLGRQGKCPTFQRDWVRFVYICAIVFKQTVKDRCRQRKFCTRFTSTRVKPFWRGFSAICEEFHR